MSGKERLTDIDRAKGLAIFLVVVGHVVARQAPEGNQWYISLKEIIYSFHMPFFMYLSGFVFYITKCDEIPIDKFSSFVAKRAERLLIPFIAFGLLIIFGKHISAEFLHVDNVSASIWRDIANIFWRTERSAALSIWYIFVLFEISLLIVAVSYVTRNVYIILAVLIPLYYVSFPDILYMERVFVYIPFFVIGGVVAKNHDFLMPIFDKYWLAFLAAFFACLAGFRLISYNETTFLISGILSIPALHAFCRTEMSKAGGILMFLGIYSFSIYLLNTITIGVTKGVMFKFFSWDNENFLIYFPILTVAGALGPYLIKRLVFSRWRYLDRATS